MERKVSARQASKKSNRNLWDRIFNGLALLAILGPLVFALIYFYSEYSIEENARQEILSAIPKPGIDLRPSKVCMNHHGFLATEQIPVTVNGKTYYGCCGSCTNRLIRNEELRIAIDPLSRDTVDKAIAFITAETQAFPKVLYFKTKENMYEYFKREMNMKSSK